MKRDRYKKYMMRRGLVDIRRLVDLPVATKLHFWAAWPSRERDRQRRTVTPEAPRDVLFHDHPSQCIAQCMRLIVNGIACLCQVSRRSRKLAK
jgi:hypothetical protein